MRSCAEFKQDRRRAYSFMTLDATVSQAAALLPLLKDAHLSGGTVFCQARRGCYPDHEKVTFECQLLDAAASVRVRDQLTKEAGKIAKKKGRKVTMPEPCPADKPNPFAAFLNGLNKP